MSMKDFRTLEPVGKGAFASVFKVRRRASFHWRQRAPARPSSARRLARTLA
jgi:hypothetical protein